MEVITKSYVIEQLMPNGEWLACEDGCIDPNNQNQVINQLTKKIQDNPESFYRISYVEVARFSKVIATTCKKNGKHNIMLTCLSSDFPVSLNSIINRC